MRQMDEFFAIQKNLGEVVGVISLENEEEPANYVKTPDMWQEPVVEEAKEEEAKPAAEEEEEAAAAEELGGEKKPIFDPTKFRWSITDGKPHNLPQLLREYLGNKCTFDVKNWKAFQMNQHDDAAVKALDEFCARIVDENKNFAFYQQVIFNESD